MFSSNATQVSSANYIEDVFSTYLYTGNGSTQTITNGIDLSTKGGMIWNKIRDNSFNFAMQDTVRGANNILYSSDAVENQAYSTSVSSFNANGYTLGSETLTNYSSGLFVGWTLRKQPKFFDIVTWTGNGANRNISHNLGSVPGCIFVKRLNASADWRVYHRSIGNAAYLILNDTSGSVADSTVWNSTTPTSTVFTVGSNYQVNASGGTYVAYIFAHDSGGFGLTGTDNVISCGSYTGSGSAGKTVDLGYEPQWVIIKKDDISQWNQYDNMRGFVGDSSNGSKGALPVNYASTESSGSDAPYITSTGLGFASGNANYNGAGIKYIYIAIRRGPMKVPTSGTSVFSPNAVSTDASAVTTNFPVDLSFESPRSGSSNIFAQDRLRGANQVLYTYNTNAESTAAGSTSNFQSNTSVMPSIYGSGTSLVFWNFRRSPSFFDEVCYTGTGVARTVAHNLGVAPELMIIKRRNGISTWPVYSSTVFAISASGRLLLNETTQYQNSADVFNSTAPTSSVFTLGTSTDSNNSGSTYVAYLFATCAGVSKVGSYTGTGATQQINCGFTGGARFVLIKRTDSTGAWYVWDSARGIVAGNDPYLLLNSTAAEVTSTDYVDTYSAGFEISSTAPAAINASGGTFIFLAIA